MRQADIVKRYLQRREDVDIQETGFPFVTISRQAGVGGHELGRELIRHFESLVGQDPLFSGWDLFDQKLCAMLAQQEGGEETFNFLVNEGYKTGVHQSVYEMFVGKSEHYQLQKKVAEVIRMLARLGKVVILGRGSMCVTKDLAQGIHIRLMASEKDRVRQMMTYIGKNESEARKALQKQDKDRAMLIRQLYGRDIGDPLLYDAVFNTSLLTVQEIVSVVSTLVLTRWQRLAVVKPKARSSLE